MLQPMHYVYILRNNDDKHYIGCTLDLDKRLKHHNGNDERRFVYLYKPWKILMYREFESSKDAYDYEKLVKSYKGGNGFKKILNGEVAELAPPGRGEVESLYC